ncbi:MAG: hypothetical protein Q4G67_03085 [Actinomycetia bacterium]|nr:hypothetical protein [Actinomycetes bacterium]
MPDGTRCPDPGRECHHAGHRDDHALGSLQWLCVEHHATETHTQAAQANAARLARLRHPGSRTTRYPGLT